MSEREIVVVNVIEGENLPAHDRNGLSDPYVCFILENGDRMDKPRLKDFKHHTGTVNKTLNPNWSEVFNLASSALDEILRFYIFDHNWIAKDALLCWGEVTLQEVKDAGGYLHEREIKLTTPDGDEGGKLVASITYGTPDKEVPPPKMWSDKRAKKIAEAKEKDSHRIDRKPPKVKVSDEAIDTARDLGLDGRQVDRAYKYFNQMDKEGLGKVSFTEFDKMQKKIMSRRNKGRIVMAAATRGMNNMIEASNHKLFDAVDVNHDGFLTFVEFLHLWRNIEIETMNTSWNPIKNDVRKFQVMQRAFHDNQTGNIDPLMVPGGM